MSSYFSLLILFCALVLGCPHHADQHTHLGRRADTTADWTYFESYNWGTLRPEYALCQTGTHQSPIGLSTVGGFSQYHRPTFESYDRKVSGNWTNWGYGPEFNLEVPSRDYTALPSVSWNNETAYLKTWHIHAPADHSVDRDRSRAELHLVHVNAEGDYVAVFGIRLDAGTASSPFFAQLPEMIPFVTRPGISPEEEPAPAEIKLVQNVRMDIGLLLDAVNRFEDFWTYQGTDQRVDSISKAKAKSSTKTFSLYSSISGKERKDLVATAFGSRNPRDFGEKIHMAFFAYTKKTYEEEQRRVKKAQDCRDLVVDGSFRDGGSTRIATRLDLYICRVTMT
ncbi:MAG: hypothetical protein Q9174_005058 [Haloplaca sp. 1 TL-2023]